MCLVDCDLLASVILLRVVCWYGLFDLVACCWFVLRCLICVCLVDGELILGWVLLLFGSFVAFAPTCLLFGVYVVFTLRIRCLRLCLVCCLLLAF